jgi:C4-dicarboxylate-specific signal transduction histidine kinase
VEVVLADPPPAVLGDLVAIEQVLLNLLVNARDALAALPDGAPRQVRIAAMAEPETGMVRLTVADTAGGIAAAVLPTLFEPFVTTKGPDRGTGLGLSICYGLLRGMGGSIAAANDRDGAVFTVLLPAASAEDIAAE